MTSKTEPSLMDSFRSMWGVAAVLSAISALFAFVSIRRGAWQTIKFFLRARRERYRFSPIKIDLNLSDPGLGDFLMDLVLARAVSDLFPECGVREELTGTPPHLTLLDNIGLSSELRMQEFRDLLGKNPTSVPLLPASFASPASLGSPLSECGWSHLRRHFLAAGNVYLVNRLASRFSIDPKVYFDWKPAGAYVGIHVRASKYDSGRNPTRQQFIQDVRFLAERYPRHSIKVFSNPQPSFLPAALKLLRAAGVEVAMQESDGFVEALDEVMACDFWFQRLGGGLAVPVLYSQMPYLMLSADVRARTLYGIEKFRYAPWSNQEQRFVTNSAWARTLTLYEVYENLKIKS